MVPRQANLSWLSCFPMEDACLFPPFTHLKPTGRVQLIELSDDLRCSVIEVTPHVAS
jgi:hypothetical protein